MSDPKYKDVGPIAMLICPVCESRFAWGDVARMADWGLVNEYVDCFRPSMHSSVTAKRRLRLLQELKRLFLTSSIVYEGRQYRIDKGRVVVAVRAVCDAQKFGFRNHNYLKRVLVSGGAERVSAEGMTARQEARREEDRRQKTEDSELVTAAEFKKRHPDLAGMAEGVGKEF